MVATRVTPLCWPTIQPWWRAPLLPTPLGAPCSSPGRPWRPAAPSLSAPACDGVELPSSRPSLLLPGPTMELTHDARRPTYSSSPSPHLPAASAHLPHLPRVQRALSLARVPVAVMEFCLVGSSLTSPVPSNPILPCSTSSSFLSFTPTSSPP
ncbi:uncharacterized protein LOC100276518 [Zea mays]|jgi:hypothetical protein|uniref:Uncharacterized protein n=1 Tax=Zea mays TaxID=4577 RepID=B4FSF2_MAIZE|nr:uncharacterized protein LOC100276518 [Zea mays]ACF85045.1 unknown [Zea mays]ACG35036.1 hypothetical protein [Zea mays]|eukprot:NP_001143756.1 uncharacterized protein LOC100276518 [Zea mays]